MSRDFTDTLFISPGYKYELELNYVVTSQGTVIVSKFNINIKPISCQLWLGLEESSITPSLSKTLFLLKTNDLCTSLVPLTPKYYNIAIFTLV